MAMCLQMCRCVAAFSVLHQETEQWHVNCTNLYFFFKTVCLGISLFWDLFCTCLVDADGFVWFLPLPARNLLFSFLHPFTQEHLLFCLIFVTSVALLHSCCFMSKLLLMEIDPILQIQQIKIMLKNTGVLL